MVKSYIFVWNLTLMNAEEPVLIERVRNGDRAAFNELYGLYWVPLVNYAGLIVGDGCAEDVVQEVFVRVWLGRDKLRGDGSLRSYLLRAVYRASLNVLRANSYAVTYRSRVAQQIEESGLSEAVLEGRVVSQRRISREWERDGRSTRKRESRPISLYTT